MASATSAAVTPCRTADRACATTQPSHSLVTAMASAISSFTRAGSAPSPMAAPCSAAYPAYTSGMAARKRRPDTFSSSWISRAVLTPGLLAGSGEPSLSYGRFRGSLNATTRANGQRKQQW